jgi:hypothetical protein
MRFRKPLHLVLILSIWFAVSGRSCTETTITTAVDSTQKVSDTSGNFEGTLDDDDRFGSAIANIGDLEADGVTDLVVGAPMDDDGGTDRGAVWILFMNDDGTVDIEQKISDDEGRFFAGLDDNDQFGSAVADLGDLNGDGILDIAVGAPLDDDGGTDRGAVWILFLNANGTVQSSQKISDTIGSSFDGRLEDNDQFGGAIANIGDLNNDRVIEIAVGSRLADGDGLDRGAVWILFLARDGSVITSQKITDNSGGFDGDLNDYDYFGSSVAGINDLNADGVEDIAVGSIGDDDGGSDRGATWLLFMNPDGSVLSEQKISDTEGDFGGGLADGDLFGSSVAGLGDINGDGKVDLSVGADQDDDGGTLRGAVWVLFLERDGKLISKTKISSTSGNFTGSLADGDQFGYAITNLGDLDGDGNTDIGVGANLDDDGGTDRGAFWTLFMQTPETDIDFTLFDNEE